MCAVALPMPPTPRATAVESPKRIPMPGHWEEEPGAILREKPVEDEHEPNEPDKDPDLFRYPPPAALSELANVSSETIALVVRSSVEHVFQQVEAERQRTQETATTSDATSEGTPASLDEAEEAVASRDIGLMPELHITRETTTNSQSTSSQGSVDEQSSRNQRRHRFGIRRIFQHIVEKGESSSNNSFSIGSLPAHIHHIPPPAPSPGTSAPSSFTQLIHKHIKSSSAIESGSSTEIVECVSCFDDIRPRDGVKTQCHFYCKECFQQLITTALESEAQWPPKCCLNVVPFRTVMKHARPDVVKRYREKDEEFKVPAENRIYCSTADCGQWIRKFDKANKIARCSQGHSMCVMCRGPPHPANIACPQDRDRQIIDQLAEDEGWRRCSKCAVLVEHKEACQHMTCRCGNQFCYVCGSQWRTCVCTSDMLATIKQRATARRRERETKEAEEDAWLSNALRLIEEYERETHVLEEKARATRREELRRQRAAERVRREEARLDALDVRYEELRETLAKVNAVQKALLNCAQHRDTEEAKIREAAEQDDLAHRQDLEYQELQTLLNAKMTERELEWDRDFRVRVVYEKRLEDEYGAVLRVFWAEKLNGEERAEEAMRSYMEQNDQRWDSWSRRRESDLEKHRYEAEEELAVREEIMETMRLRQEKELADRRVERDAKYTAERKWFELVVAERTRMLSEIEAVDRESGGLVDEDSSEGDELDLMLLDDNLSL